MPPIRIGISLCSAHPVSDPREGARFLVERTIAAREAGLDSLFLGDHHAVPVPYYQNVPMLGRLLAEWGDRPAGALFLLPLWNPMLVAEQIGTLAAIASGRFIAQCALGAGAEQFAAMRADLRTRARVFEESLETILTLLRGERVGGARIALVPAEPVETWIGSVEPRAIDRTARMADGWLASPGLVAKQAQASLASYREACAKHSREPSAVAIRRDIYVGESDAEAEAATARAVADGYRGIDPEALVIGAPERVAERFLELAGMGFTDVIVRNMLPDQAACLRSIERLARVREIVNGA